MNRQSPLVILAPNFPPTVCGVGDYTAQLLAAWPTRATIRTLLRPALPGVGATVDATLDVRGERVPVRAVTPSGAAFRQALAALGPCDLLVQYSAYGFDPKFGCPASLCAACADWAREQRAGRLVLMFHELWHDEWPRWHPHFWIQAWHRRALGRMARAATQIFTSTAQYARNLRLLLGDQSEKPVTVLPVGSNIPPPSSAKEETREPGLFLLFGLQGTRLRCLREMRDSLRALARPGRLRRLVLLGRGQGETMAREEEALLRETLPPPARWETLGELPAAEISAWLRRAEFALSAQDEANFTKSGTLMACCAHGLNVVSPYAGAEKPAPFCWLTSPAEILAGIAPASFAERGTALRLWYEQHAAWPILAAAYAQAFG